MDKEKITHNIQRTEEVRDIIDRMPQHTGRIIAFFVICLASLLMFFGWVIDYPEKVTGPISITSRQAPVRLVSNTSGKLHILKSNNDNVKEKEIIAYIESPARLEDIIYLEKYLIDFNYEKLCKLAVNPKLPENMALGDLSMYYLSFLSALEKLILYNANMPYEKRKESLTSLLTSQMRLKEFTTNQLKTNTTSLTIAGKNVHRDSLLFSSATIAEFDLDRSMVSYLSMVENNQGLKKEDASIQMQTTDTRNKLHLLELERIEAEQKLKMDLYSGFNELANNIRKWKLTYTFSAPFTGKAEYLNFWRDNDFIAAGTPLISIIPAGNSLLGQVYLPSQGAGKVSIGQDVVIKLDNYPFNEYGSVKGKVKMISSLANQTEEFAKKNDITTYLISVELPNMLTTNYGTTLTFTSEIKGVADILTKKRKLLQRLFDNLKYIASKK